jgi:hypothetical protein
MLTAIQDPTPRSGAIVSGFVDGGLAVPNIDG